MCLSLLTEAVKQIRPPVLKQIKIHPEVKRDERQQALAYLAWISPIISFSFT